MTQAITDYVDLVGRLRRQMLAAIDGLPSAALDWAPLPADASFLAVLAHHCAGIIRIWLVEESTGRDVGRDRDAEFAARGMDAAALAAMLDAACDEGVAALRTINGQSLGRARAVTANHPIRGALRSGHHAAGLTFCHVSEHIGQMQLTRQLWEARST